MIVLAVAHRPAPNRNSSRAAMPVLNRDGSIGSKSVGEHNASAGSANVQGVSKVNRVRNTDKHLQRQYRFLPSLSPFGCRGFHCSHVIASAIRAEYVLGGRDVTKVMLRFSEKVGHTHKVPTCTRNVASTCGNRKTATNKSVLLCRARYRSRSCIYCHPSGRRH